MAVLLALLAWAAPWQAARAQTTTTCYPAEEKGVDGPVDYGAYCWIDFSPLNLAQAKSGSGQSFRVELRGGAYLTFDLKITSHNAAGANMFAVPVPSWTGAAFGNSAFNGIPGNPILYQDQNNQNGPENTVVLSNLTLHANGSSELPFVFVAADGESSNSGETLEFTTSGAPWDLVAAPGLSNPNRNMPVLSPPTIVGAGTGSQTVTETGTDGGPDGEGSYVFTTDNSPGTVTAYLKGSGLQGVLFGVKYYTIGLSLTKAHQGHFIAGGTGSYTLTVTNTVTYPSINPPDTPQPIRVVDTLPTGLSFVSASGSGWTCGAVGQVVTCDIATMQDLTISKTFPPITINVAVAPDAPASITNIAEVYDPTTSTLVFNVCEVADNGVCPNSATSTTGDPTVVLHSNLSTSTKGVFDVNGGDVEPGDVLRYTITLRETAGLATTASVLDHMPAHVGNLTVVSVPDGSVDSSSPTGGNNNTGRLDISGIDIAANGTATIVYEVTVAGDAAPGTTIDNTATITNGDPNGAGGSAVAPTVTVSQSLVPVAGKVLYLHNDQDTAGGRDTLRRTLQSANAAAITINGGTDHDWLLDPGLAKGLAIGANSTVSLVLLVRCTGGGNSCNGGTKTWTATLYDSDANEATAPGDANAITPLIAQAPSASYNYTTATPVTLNLPVSAAKSLAQGRRLRLRVRNTGNRTLEVSQYGAGERSRLVLSDSTVINVDSVTPYANNTCTGTPDIRPGSTIYLCAVVSDPYGASDINPSPGGTPPSIVVYDTGGASMASGTMTEVSSATATKTFRYAYTIPANTTSLGEWSAAVTAWEGTEHEVYHVGTGTFEVLPPVPLLSTSGKVVVDVDGGDAEPGDVLRYTITLRETAGANATGVSVVDDMPAHVGNLTVASAPPGSTDASTPTGGANGTGRLEITGISVPANGTATIVYEVTIDEDTVAGTVLSNSADILNPGGANVTVSAEDVVVAASSIPPSGAKYLYLRNEGSISSQLRRARPTNNGTAVAIAAGNNLVDWEMVPVVPAGETLALPATISAHLVIAATTTTGSNTDRTVRASLWHHNGSQTVQLGGDVDFVVPGTATSPTPYTVNFTGTGSPTLGPGEYLVLRLQNRGTGTRNIDVHQRSGSTWPTSYSYLVFDTTTVINIDAAGAYANPGGSPGESQQYAAYVEGDQVYLRAEVSDPFGTDDISSVSVAIRDPDGALVALGEMTPLADPDTSDGSRRYEFVFIVPEDAKRGAWTVTATAEEGVEGTVEDTANFAFNVQGLVTLGKTWGMGANPGDEVELTIAGGIRSTAGTSTAGGGTTAARAAAAGGAVLTLGEGFVSGAPGHYTVALTCTRTKDGGAVAVSGSGLSRTITMPGDSSVACAWSNEASIALTVVKLSRVLRDPVSGNVNPKAIPGAIVEYEIIVANPAHGTTVDADTVVVDDPLPPQVELVVADYDGGHPGPVAFFDGTPASGLDYSFVALGDAGDDIEFRDGDGDPVAPQPQGPDDTDPGVRRILVAPKGSFSPGTQFTVKFKARVK